MVETAIELCSEQVCATGIGGWSGWVERIIRKSSHAFSRNCRPDLTYLVVPLRVLPPWQGSVPQTSMNPCSERQSYRKYRSKTGDPCLSPDPTLCGILDLRQKGPSLSWRATFICPARFLFLFFLLDPARLRTAPLRGRPPSGVAPAHPFPPIFLLVLSAWEAGDAGYGEGTLSQLERDMEWYLVQEPGSRFLAFVRHQPNRASGGNRRWWMSGIFYPKATGHSTRRCSVCLKMRRSLVHRRQQKIYRHGRA